MPPKKPRGSTGLTRVQPAPSKVFGRVTLPKAVEDAVTLVEEALGGRIGILKALSFAESTPTVQRLLSLLGDPACDRFSLADLCVRGNITPGDLLAAYRKAQLGVAQALSTRVIAENLPAVTADVMKRAAEYQAVCDACEGTGTHVPDPTKAVPNPSPEPCKACHGRGSLTIVPSLDRQKVALDLGQLVPKTPTMAVQVNQSQTQQTLNAGTGNLAELQQAIGDLLYGSAPIE
jgi:hypothetical protein